MTIGKHPAWALCRPGIGRIGMLLFFWGIMSTTAYAENYLLNGGQESKIEYQMVQKVDPSPGTRSLVLSYVVPQPFVSPTYRQRIENLDVHFSPPPSGQENTVDGRGNKIIEARWKPPMERVRTTIRFTAVNSVALSPMQTHAPFPVHAAPIEVRAYVASTEQVNSNYQPIVDQAQRLTASAQTQFDAVQRILIWVVDHMHYVLTPTRYDAIHAFETGRGNCQNYSHLAAALMRAVGIPVRIVNGITLKQPYDIAVGDGTLTIKMAQGRHSWIEVYFPDMDWVPFDPQGTELFVSNRFIRVEVGLDNAETVQDGLIRWTRIKQTSGTPEVEESIDAGFKEDRVRLTARKEDYGPREMLLCPEVQSDFSKPSVPEEPTPDETISEEDVDKLQFVTPYTFGNLEFPKNVSFVSGYGPARKTGAGLMEMRKNFLVETAEYVTTKGKQYAQTFMLKHPMHLETIGLALHRFNTEGQLWLELFEDRNGRPGPYIATSSMIMLEKMPFAIGYDWTDFDFGSSPIRLSPGRYWVALGFTGMPIVNWFFTYGKPVGPQDGTRYREMFDESWSRSLAYEFNYRVVGLTPE